MKFMLIDRTKKDGFALPTILIASVVMLIVLLSAIGASSSIRAAIDSQYYNQLAREATESGLAVATECLKANPTPSWTDAAPLRPGSSCNESAAESGYVLDTARIKTSFTVGGYTTDANGRTLVSAKGVVNLKRASAPTETWKSYEQVTRRSVDIVPKFAALSGNDSHTCALASSQVFCWGNNTYGQLGNGTADSTLYPTPIKYVNGLKPGTVTKVGTGNSHTCVMAGTNSTDQKIWCWGRNNEGQLGDGTLVQKLVPNLVTGVLAGKQIQDLSVGAYQTCVIASSRAYCWGWNPDGQLGDGTLVGKTSPVAVATAAPSALGTKNLGTISTQDYHTCATSVGANDTDINNQLVFCWGRNLYGQLGNNNATGTTPSTRPVQALGTGVREVGTGAHHTCMLAGTTSATLRVWCWGFNNSGQLGYNDNVTRAQHGGAVVGSIGANYVTAMSVGDYHVCAVVLAKAHCWGRNSDAPGQVGNNSTANQLQPIAVLATSGPLLNKTIVSIAAGDFHTCAVDNTKKAYCWGRNNYGQLGDNTTTNTLVPVNVYTQNFKPVYTDF